MSLERVSLSLSSERERERPLLAHSRLSGTGVCQACIVSYLTYLSSLEQQQQAQQVLTKSECRTSQKNTKQLRQQFCPSTYIRMPMIRGTRLNLTFFAFTVLVSVHASPSHQRLAKSTFIPPATPSLIASSSPSSSSDMAGKRHARRRQALVTGYGLFDHANPNDNMNSFVKKKDEDKSGSSSSSCLRSNFYSVGSPLMLASKKASSHVGASSSKGGKVQVKLLKYVEGTGSIGDIVLVAPAFFENKLKRTKSAILISDEEVHTEKLNLERSKKEQLQQALDMQSKIQETAISFSKKAGPEGHLFGGVGRKDILEELKRKFPLGTLEGKQIKIISLKRSDGEEVKGDIKDTGSYLAMVSLLVDVNAEFRVEVTAS
jgi:ribosomal protein L9